MKFNRPFKTIDEQIEYLKSDHKLIIEDVPMAKRALFNYSYYDLINGYKEVFMVDDEYQGTTFNYLLNFYLLDIDIQNLLIKYATLVEARFKTIFSYYLSENYPEDYKYYLNISLYTKQRRNNNQYKILKSAITDAVEIAENPYYNPTLHYKNNHNHIPAWILFKNLNFDTCTKLFRFIDPVIKGKTINAMSSVDIIDKQYRNEFFISSLVIIRKFRNAIAHNLQFVCHRTHYRLNFSKVKSHDLLITN